MARGGFGQIFSHVAFAITLVAALGGFFAALIGQCVLEVKYHQQPRTTGSAVGVQWFGIILEAFLIIGIVLALAGDNFGSYRLQITNFLAIATVFAVLGVNSGIFNTTSFQIAIGAGWLVLAVVNILWLLYFTSEEDALFGRMFDAGSGHSFLRGNDLRRNRSGSSHHGPMTQGGVPYGSSQGFSPAMSSAPKIGNVGGIASASNASLQSGPMGQTRPAEDNKRAVTPVTTNSTAAPASTHGEKETTDFVFKARALYSYNASPDDPNEISFTKGEVIDVTDSSGKWWQARKSDGTRGIAPSNYLQQI